MNAYRPSLGRIFNLGLIILLAFVSVLAIAAIHNHERRHALEEARAIAQTILERNLATHYYFNQQLKPSVFEKDGNVPNEDYFEPRWMSSTYAVREIDKYFQDITRGPTYYYKECAINARSPINEADQFESAFLRELNSDPGLVTRSGIRVLDGQHYFTVLYRGETMESGCMMCHSVPAAAPAEMVEIYGPERSFSRHVGDIVSAVSIRIPLEEAYREVNQLTLHLSMASFLFIFLIYAGVSIFHRRFLFKPLGRLEQESANIARNPDHIGHRLEEPFGRELSDLARSFNMMSERLAGNREDLENRVEERTAALRELNRKLEQDMETIRALTEERDVTIDQLESALAEVSILRGILPVCMKCRKIKADQDSWEELESYLNTRIETRFSHGYCPDCAEEMITKMKREEP